MHIFDPLLTTWNSFKETQADKFVKEDLRDPSMVEKVVDQPFDEVYQIAADIGGAGFIFSGENDVDIMCNSAMINMNIVKASVKDRVKKIFYSFSAYMYPERN